MLFALVHSFNQFVLIYIYIYIFQGLTIIAFNGGKLNWKTIKLVLSLGPTYVVMKFIESKFVNIYVSWYPVNHWDFLILFFIIMLIFWQVWWMYLWCMVHILHHVDQLLPEYFIVCYGFLLLHLSSVTYICTLIQYFILFSVFWIFSLIFFWYWIWCTYGLFFVFYGDRFW